MQTGIYLVRQWLSVPANPSPCDGCPRQVRNVEHVTIAAAKCHVRRAAETDRPAIPGEQRLHANRADPPDFIGRVTTDVKISVHIERETVRETSARGLKHLRAPDF